MGCVGAAMLKPLGLESWVAEDEAAYIEKAVAYASDLTALSKLRGSLRQRLEKSSLLDAAACAQKAEDAYRQMLTEFSQSKAKVAVKEPSQQQLANLLDHYNNGRFGDAEKLAISITEEFPQHEHAWRILGAVLGVTGRNSEAVGFYQKAVALSPQDASIHCNLGVALQELGRLDDAEASLRQAIALKPDLAEAYNNLGITLKKLRKLEEAEASYKKAIALKPDYATDHSNLGKTLRELNKFDESAVCIV